MPRNEVKIGQGEWYLDKKHNYFYKITNLVNGKYYYGIRSTDKEPDKDSYFGSGMAIKKAIAKYEKENFSKEIVADYLTRKEASDHEKRVVTLDLVKLEECYNCKTGGDNEGFLSEDTKRKIGKSNKGKVKSAELLKKMSDNMKGDKHPLFGKKHLNTTIDKMKAKRRGRLLSEDQKNTIGNFHRGKTLSKEVRDSISRNCPHKKVCLVEGIEFHSVGAAAAHYKLSTTTVRKRLLSSKWEEWCYG